MLLRSNWGATNIAKLTGELSLDAYKAATGAEFSAPVPLDHFIDYGEWCSGAPCPTSTDDSSRGSTVTTARSASSSTTVSASTPAASSWRADHSFAWRPPHLADLPPELASHSSEHSHFDDFRGKEIAIVGGGQSALESAALATEAGAQVEVFVRSRRIVWLRGRAVKQRLGRLGPVVYAPTDVGPLWYSRVVALPDAFRRLPRRLDPDRATLDQARGRTLAGAAARRRAALGRTVREARADEDGIALTMDDGDVRRVAHLLLGTGYRVDVARYGFLAPEVVAAVRRRDGYPVL